MIKFKRFILQRNIITVVKMKFIASRPLFTHSILIKNQNADTNLHNNNSIFSIKFGYSQKKFNSQVRKLLQICETAIPSLMVEGDISAALQFINQIVLVLISSLIDSDKSQSKKVLNYLFAVLVQIKQSLTSAQAEKNLQTLKTLSNHIEKINQLSFIIQVDQLYLSYLDRFKGKQNADYVQIISKLAENCIFGQQFQKALKYLTQADEIIKKLQLIIHEDIKIQNLINFGLTFLSLGRIEQSIEAYKQALKLCQKLPKQNTLQSYKIAIVECLGDIFKDRKHFEEALSYYQQGFRIIKNGALGSSIHSIVLLYKMAQTSFSLQKYSEAVNLSRQIQNILEQDNDLKNQFQFQNQRILLTAQTLILLKKNEQSINYFQKYVLQAQKPMILDQQKHVSVLIKLVGLYQEVSNNQKCMQYLKSLSKYYRREGKDIQQQQCLSKIKSIESKIKN